jgi:hypothetical protein
MQLDWILSPMAQYTFLALALAGCLALFVSMKREIAQVRLSARESNDAATSSAAAMTAELAAELTAELAVIRKDMETIEPVSLTGQELNLTRRAQALRMRRRGESPATIAAALRVPRNEIDLLLKLETMARGEGSPAALDPKAINAA